MEIKKATPKARIVAWTHYDQSGVDKALADCGIYEWAPSGPDDACNLIELAGKSCYMSFDLAANKNLTMVNGRSNHDYIQQGIIGQKHGSCLEHATVSVMFTNVSRIVTHELVRHRAGAAFSQTSGRYVRNEIDAFYIPDAIEANPKAKAAYLKAIEGMNEALRAMEEATGVDSLPFAEKKALTSAFRRVVGNGQPNNLLMTANHRTWRHVIELRTSVHAEEEVRKVVRDLAIQLKHRFPTIYDDMSINDAGECVFKHSKV